MRSRARTACLDTCQGTGGNRDSVRKLHDAVEYGYFVVVLGARRVGKTSVVKTLLNHYGYKYIYFDLSLYIGLRAVSFRSLAPAEIGLDEETLSGEVQLSLALISLKLKKVKLTSEAFQTNFLTILKELNNKYNRFIIVFDEA